MSSACKRHVAAILDKTIREEPITLLGAQEITKYYTLEYIRSACQKAGSQITYALQHVRSRIIPTGAHEKIVTGTSALKSLKIIDKPKETKLDPNSLDDLRFELAGLFALLLELETIYDKGEISTPTDLYPQNFKELVYFGVVGRKIIDTLLCFHGGSYSLQHISEVFAKFSPSTDDLNNINNPENLKSLFETYLNLIINKENDPLFQPYIKYLKESSGNFKSFSAGNDISADDFKLIVVLDGILNEIFSYPGFTLITAGFFRIKHDYTIELYAPTEIELGKRFQKLGLKFVSVPKPESKPYSKRFFIYISQQRKSFVDYFLSMIIFGHFKVVEVESQYKALFSKPPVNTLANLFNNYQFSRQSFKYYFNRRSELYEVYKIQLSKFEESLSLERILQDFYSIPSIKIDNFMSKFNQYLKDIPFDVNAHTLHYFIDYYDLNWEIEGDRIINTDFVEPKDPIKDKLDKLISFCHRFSSIDVNILAEYLGIEPNILKYMLSNFDEYLKSKGVRLIVRDDYVVNLDKS